ncbi:hypothetical protein BBJ28_00024663 [Nothophytophthora sp. Chile5]|nr:hypothetical protein BBJ28_00024663 [Nothophytophthora sp. Chile5]
MAPEARTVGQYPSVAHLRLVDNRPLVHSPSAAAPVRQPTPSAMHTPRSPRLKPIAMYVGIALYAGGLMLWWVYLRGDMGRLNHWRNAVLPNASDSDSELYQDAGGSSHASQPSDSLLMTFVNGIGPSDPELLALHKLHGVPDLTCVGWRQTGGCSPDGPREPERDLGCGGIVKSGSSGYCLLRDEATGQESQAMRVGCNSMRKETPFKCSQAVDFSRVAPQIDALIVAKQQELLPAGGDRPAQTQTRIQIQDPTLGKGDTQQLRGTAEPPAQIETLVQPEPSQGVVMVMYPKLLPSVHTTIRLLRSYGCTLRVELWYLESEMGASPLASYRVLQSLVHDFGPISLRGIKEEIVTGFNSKVFALAHSALDQVLFLDADNAPVKDPTYLFMTPEFLAQGTIFWPDFWHPVNTIFNVNAESLIWELVGTPFVDMFEQESGQLLIDRRRTRVALQVVQLLALREPRHFTTLKLLHGDKDLFRLAWLKTQTPFHMIATPAAAAGMLKAKQFCGMTMVQHDTRGDVLFLHRNGKKLTGEEDREKDRTWTHLQQFVFPEELASVDADADKRYAFLKEHYHVAIFGGGKPFVSTRMCYGDRYMKSPHYQLTPWSDLPWHDLEDTLHDFAHEASQL